jgi:internalin A
MKRITTLVAAATLCLYAAAASAQAPKELDLKVVYAWIKAGAEVRSYGPDPFGYWSFSPAKPKDPAALPAFCFRAFKLGVIARLPAPSTPFAMDLYATNVTDAGLKELAGFKNLQALHLGNTKVTGASLKKSRGRKGVGSRSYKNNIVLDRLPTPFPC